ncbi:MAG: serine protease [Gemmatimonadota bacterium]|jgi:hypothetical protein
MGKRRHLTKSTRIKVYQAAGWIDSEAEQELGVQIPFDVYLQDPYVAETDPKFGMEALMVRWEPGLSDGPTSARFAVVDYNADTGRLSPMATWDAAHDRFLDAEGNKVDRENPASLQFDQVNVWALLQRALAFFEGGSGLGRPIPFGFEGNRLIVVPHAGYGRNAFYDRQSKSLQFYYFNDEDGNEVRTCLSTDIVNHEFGHAMLDGVRPHLYESPFVETAAFHESIGDLTAILIILRNNDFRQSLVEATGGDLAGANPLGAIAEQFGKAVEDRPYLRTAYQRDDEKKTMSDVKDDQEPHRVSEVLTGAMFDILIELARHYVDERGRTVPQAFWNAAQRMQHMAVQPLDLLPPVDVTFRDYALAVLRAEELANPTDPHRYNALMRDVFHEREILGDADVKDLEEPRYLYERLDLDVFHDVWRIARSRGAAYRFLDDNRDALFIPRHQDVIVADLYDANKLGREAGRLPRQIILAYLWREEVALDGERFGEYEGETTTMLCGGTLVFDADGNVCSWARKPGTERGEGRRWNRVAAEGEARRKAFLDELARRIRSGHVGAALGGSKGLVGTLVPPLTVRRENGVLRFSLSPHLTLDADLDHFEGRRGWQVSS